MACCVPGCYQRPRSKTYGPRPDGRKVSFHAIPAKNPAKEIWMEVFAAGGTNLSPNAPLKVCSNHFAEECYFAGYANHRRLLKPDAFPTVLLPWIRGNITNKSTQTIVCKETVPANEQLQDQDVEDIIFDIPNCSEVPSLESSRIENVPALESEVLETPMDLDTLTENKKCKCESLVGELMELQTNYMSLEAQLDKVKRENNKLQAALSHQKKCVFIKRQHLAKMKIKIRFLEKKVKRTVPKLDNLEKDDDVRFYTGMPDKESLMSLYCYLDPGEKGENLKYWRSKTMSTDNKSGRPRNLKPTEEFLMVMMRLRLGLFVKDLGDRFGVSSNTVSKITITWLNLLYIKLGQLNIWPSREEVDKTMPEEFKREYPNTRVILDATEVKCEKPNSMVLQSTTYSTYKSTNTLKGLIGIDPSGLVTFVSSLYTGCISDKEITRRSGVLELDFEPMDGILCDKGFIIKDMLDEKGLILNMPPFLKDKGQFSPEEIEETQRIASLRIHVERRIQRIRTYHIFDRPISITLCPVVNQIWTVCVILSNFQSPIIKCNEDFYDIDTVINNEDLENIDALINPE